MQTWRQIELIVEKLDGQLQADVSPVEMDEPWRTVYARLGDQIEPAASEREAVLLLWKATEGMDGREGLMERVLEMRAEARAQGEQPAEADSLSDLAPRLRPIEWLWPGWLPRGLLSLLGAAPGAGKSLVALDLARRVIQGDAWPDGAGGEREGGEARGMCDEGSTVVYVDAEAIPQVLYSRAAAWGVDLGRLFALLPSNSYGVLDLGDAGQQARLVKLVERVRPELVVVDSLSSITTKGENNVEEVRAILSFLASVTREQGPALLLIHHLRKGAWPASARTRAPGEAVTAQELRGSGHITAMARSVVALSPIYTGPEAEGNSPRRLEVVKSNLGAHPRPVGVRFEPDERGAPVVIYGEPPEAYRPPTQVDECAEWLVERLEEAGEPMRPKDVVALAAEMGFKQGTVYRARKRLQGVVVDTDEKKSPANCWGLRGE